MTDLVEQFQRWTGEVSGPSWYWYVKILSGNDTLLNQSHQAGPYIPRSVVFQLFPGIAGSRELNPRRAFAVSIDSHGSGADVTVIWYNNGIVAQGTRNEARITNWGGSASPLLDPEATGSAVVLAFHREDGRDADACRVWLCSTVEEEEALADLIGPVEPGEPQFLHATTVGVLPVSAAPADAPCRLDRDSVPRDWRYSFPEASEIVEMAAANLPSARGLPADERLLRRRECEFEIFRSLEDILVLPRIHEGFATVDLFVAFANSVTNRRKSRSGMSLELHARKLFEEESLPHSHDEISEGRKRPDFLFPSAAAYRDERVPAGQLQMLGVKTTCKDRWRQILNEADRIPEKCLLTLQEGVSQHQFAEMQAAGVTLVVPRPLHSRYPESVRARLLSVGEFIAKTRAKILP